MSDLKDSLQDFFDRVEAGVIKEQKEQMFTLLRRVILITPQDESVCVANWFITVNFQDAKATQTSDRDGMAAMTRGVGEIEKFKQLGVLTLTNPMPYALRITEYGHSKQTPPGTLSAIVAQLETEFFRK
jgi:hypothetical protein